MICKSGVDGVDDDSRQKTMEDVEKRDGESGPALEQFASHESPLVKRNGMGREKYPRVGVSLFTHLGSIVLAYTAASIIPEKRSQSIPTDKGGTGARARVKNFVDWKNDREGALPEKYHHTLYLSLSLSKYAFGFELACGCDFIVFSPAAAYTFSYAGKPVRRCITAVRGSIFHARKSLILFGNETTEATERQGEKKERIASEFLLLLLGSHSAFSPPALSYHYDYLLFLCMRFSIFSSFFQLSTFSLSPYGRPH